MTLSSGGPRGGLFAAAFVAASLIGAASAQAEDRHVRIINETSHTIVHFYASNVNRKSWEEDILGRDVLRPGEDVNINVDDGSGHCKYDFLAVFDDGDKLERHGIDVCKVGYYRYTEDE